MARAGGTWRRRRNHWSVWVGGQRCRKVPRVGMKEVSEATAEEEEIQGVCMEEEAPQTSVEESLCMEKEVP